MQRNALLNPGPTASVMDEDASAARRELMWRRATQVAILVIALIAVAFALIVARPVIIPFVAAVIIGSVIGPAIEALGKRGVPTFVSAGVMVGLLLAIGYGLAMLIAAPLTGWIDRAPEIADTIRQRFAGITPMIAQMKAFTDAISSVGRPATPPMPVDIADATVLQSMMSTVTPAIGELIIFVGSLLFFLAGRARIKGKLVQTMGSRSVRLGTLRVFRVIESRLGAYLVTATLINMGLGVACALMTWALGLPSPVVWGVLAFALNYIPYIGPAMMIGILALVGLISFPGIFHGLAPAAIFIVLTTIEGQFLMPLIVGRRVSLNPLAVFLSMAAWTWMWGPVGTFLAVPLLIAGKALLEEMIAPRKPTLPG